MPITTLEDGEQRSLSNLSKKMGYSGTQLLQRWSAQYDWVRRANAYADERAQKQITLVESKLAEYTQEVVKTLTGNLAKLDKILDDRLNYLVDHPDDVDGRELQRITAAIKVKDDLARRAAGMPVTFRDTDAEEQDYEDNVYTIGGDV